MKNYLFHALAVFISCSHFSLASDKIVGGFYPDWVSPSNINSVQFDKLTDVFYAFIAPTNTGQLEPTTPGALTSVLQPLVTAAHNAGTRVHISIGGKNDSYNFSGVVTNPTYRQNFVNDLADLIRDYNLDGVNIDWEHPEPWESANFDLLMQEIRAEVNSLETELNREINLSMAVFALVYHNDGISDYAVGLCDHIYVMAFDAYGACCVCDNTNHSSLLIAQRAIAKWTTGLATTCGGDPTGRNLDMSKFVLAIPFYSNSNWYSEYDYFAAGNPSAFYNDADGIRDGYGFNSCPLIQQKVDLIMEQYDGAGIWAWELTADLPEPYSLLSCMYEAMEPYLCEAPTPNLGEDISICGQNQVTLNTNVSTASGRTFTWKRNGQTLVSNSGVATTYNASTAGTYTVEIKQGDCSSTGEIEVVGTLPTIDLGEDLELCSPSSATISTGIDASGKSFTWKKNGNTLSSETGNSIVVSEAGTYEVTVSATGCINQSDEIVVTSGLPTTTSDTICSEGTANLTASSNVDWYDAETAGNLLNSGSSYAPYISSNSTYYVAASGASNETNTTLKSSLSGGWQANGQVYGSQFTAHIDLTLESVDVDAEGGNVTINVVADDGVTVIETKTFTSISGLTTLTLDFNLAAGTYYLNAVGSTTQLYVDPNEVADYSVSGIIDVKGTAHNDWVEPYGDEYVLSENYGNLVNLVVVSGSSCDRVAVNAVIDESHEDCLITSTSSIDNSALLSVFPNPSVNIFQVIALENITAELFDMSGKLIEQFQFTAGQNTFGEQLEAGVYFLQTADNSLRIQIVKK
jgi:hypothetical protein